MCQFPVNIWYFEPWNCPCLHQMLKIYGYFLSCSREGIKFGSNCVLERVGFGLKCVLKRVRVPRCRPSRGKQFHGENTKWASVLIMIRRVIAQAVFSHFIFVRQRSILRARLHMRVCNQCDNLTDAVNLLLIFRYVWDVWCEYHTRRDLFQGRWSAAAQVDHEECRRCGLYTGTRNTHCQPQGIWLIFGSANFYKTDSISFMHPCIELQHWFL